MTTTPLHFEISPAPDETARACRALVDGAVSKKRGTWFFGFLCASVTVGSFLLPPSHDTTFLVGIVAVYATLFGFQAVGRANARELRERDPHSLETHIVEIGPQEISTSCSHVTARYPWQEFSKVLENSEFYLFVRSNGGGAAIPKRLLDATAEEELRLRISEWSPDRGAGLAKAHGNGSSAN